MLTTDMTEEQLDLHAALMSDLEYYGCELDHAKCNYEDNPTPETLRNLNYYEDLVMQIEARLSEF